jgi:tRNA dimethylallyltransferase
MKNSKLLVVIAGATAVGKTDLCVALAKHFDTEVISADSRQFYIEMNIGTAKPSDEDMQGVKHHFINNLSVKTPYNIGKYEEDALACIENIFTKNDVAILTGGSGLYLKAVCEGLDETPEADQQIRSALLATYQKEGLAPLLLELSSIDPVFYEMVDKANPHRVMRGIEVFRSTGIPFSDFRTGKKAERPFHILKICLDRPREQLYQRIDSRMDIMLANGLVEEVKQLYSFKGLSALQTVGYKEIFDYLDNQYDWQECVRLLKRNSRRYAKRQLTWFRRDKEYKWFSPTQIDLIIAHIEENLFKIQQFK